MKTKTIGNVAAPYEKLCSWCKGTKRLGKEKCVYCAGKGTEMTEEGCALMAFIRKNVIMKAE